MFGELEDDAMESCETGAVDSLDSLDVKIAKHLAQKTEVMVKSQQRGEPDLTINERMEIVTDLLQSNPSQFLYREVL